MKGKTSRGGMLILIVVSVLVLLLLFEPAFTGFSVGEITYTGGESLSVVPNENTTINLDNYFVNADTYLATETANLKVDVIGSVLTIMPEPGFIGEETITLIASNDNTTNKQYVTVIVDPFSVSTADELGTYAVPTTNALVLNATDSPLNRTTANLTLHLNATDADGDPFKNITVWFVDEASTHVLNMPFENNTVNLSNSTRDYTPFENNGTVVNATYVNTGGFDGFGAYQFDGDTDEINIQDDDSLDLTTALTITFWANANTTPAQAILVSKWASSQQSYFMDLASGRPRLFVGTTGTDAQFETSSVTLSTNQWNHIAGVYDGGGQTLKIYINGVLDGSSTSSGTPPSSLFVGSSIVTIGHHRSATYFNGLIDEVVIWNIQ